MVVIRRLRFDLFGWVFMVCYCWWLLVCLVCCLLVVVDTCVVGSCYACYDFDGLVFFVCWFCYRLWGGVG